MEFKWQALYDRKYHFSTLIWPQVVKWKFRILTAHLLDMPNHILEYQLSTSENVDVVQVTNFKEKKEKSFFDPHLTPRGKIPKPYWASTGHGQSSPRISFVYSLKRWWRWSDKTTLENVNFQSLFTPGDKMNILKPYCAS